ncbi:MAG: hypothetical protein ACE10K_10070 [Rhodothermales bacterium]
MPQTRSISPKETEALETAIREAQAFEITLKEAPVPQPPLNLSEIDQLLAEAREYGIDLSLLVRNLQLSPTERLEKLQGAAEFIRELRASMHHHEGS